MVVISIHAPRVGSDEVASLVCSLPGISIHAPRVGSDAHAVPRHNGNDYFNPRSPCGERHGGEMGPDHMTKFQSTLPVWGATHYC